MVVGGAVGADIYIVASLGSAYLGPASLIAWIVAALRERKRIASERTYLERFTGPILPVAGVILCALLIYACGVSTIALGIVSILIGTPIYIFYAPRTELATLKKDFYSTEAVLSRSARTQRVFLGYLVRLVRKKS